MYTRNWLIIGVAAFAAALPATACDFHGFTLGKPSPASIIEWRFGTPPQRHAPGIPDVIQPGAYLGHIDLDGLPVSTSIEIDAAGNVAGIGISFDPAFFDELAARAIQKWDRPTSTGKERAANAYGREVENIELDWHLADGCRVSLIKYLELNRGNLSIKAAK